MVLGLNSIEGSALTMLINERTWRRVEAIKSWTCYIYK
jgi:hypothetical protein